VSRKAPTVGFALLAKDAAQTLGPCLTSLHTIGRPLKQIVCCVDERTTDDTAAVAAAHGAEVHPIKVSDWHECGRHGRVLAQDFARARQESFSHLRPDLDFWGWIDSDDILEGGEKLPAVLAGLPADCVGLWLPYHYSRSKGVTNTLFDRERILRTSVPWRWHHRVHEVVGPVGIAAPQWARDTSVAVVHQEGSRRTEDSARRNLLLLEIDLETDPDNPRTVFYVGNQYFAMGRFDLAAEWYERLCAGLGSNPYELWQARVYQSMAYERLGDLDRGFQAAFAALEITPAHPEPYWRLAALYLLAGEWDKCIAWSLDGRKRSPPPPFVFVNPLDATFNHRLALSDAYAQQGRIGEARTELEAAHAALPDEKVRAKLDEYRHKEQIVAEGQALITLLGAKRPRQRRAWLDQLAPVGSDVRRLGRVRELVMPQLLARRNGTQPRITIHCGRALEEWYPGSLETGIGGSETAVVQISRRLHADGWHVDVFNGAGRFEGLHGGVGYWDPERYTGQKADVFVSWRQPGIAAQAPAAARKMLWCHDLNYGPQEEGVWSSWDRILGVSQWHSTMLRGYYPGIGPAQISWTPNGVDLSRFRPPGNGRKSAFRCVYASSPDRGLLRLLGMWREIARGEPSAELHVAYGWDNVDKAIAAGRQGLAELKAETEKALAVTPGVVWLGRVGQQELADLYCSAVALLYPTSFLEVSCIGAMEAMAGGAIPVTSAVGALPETIGDGGVLVDGHPESRAWGPAYLHTARAILSERNLQLEHGARALRRAQALTWDLAYQTHWRPLLDGLLAEKREMAGVAS
jgi:glycosyltransferase involved in cell wall biosynthesis